MLKRTSSASFASGMFVFPGGRVDHDDHLHKYDEHRIGPSDAQQFQIHSVGYEWRGFWVAAIRELSRNPVCCSPMINTVRLFLSRRLSLKDDFHPTGGSLCMTDRLACLMYVKPRD